MATEEDATICKMECKCDDGWLVNHNGACSCPNTNDNCKSEQGDVCSGKLNGACQCDKCFCNIVHSDDEVAVKIGEFEGDKCSSFRSECAKDDMFARYIKCKSEYCVKEKSENCWAEADCPFDGEGTTFTSSEIIQTETTHSLGEIKLNEPEDYEEFTKVNFE